jgi:hypothetical protein
MKTAVVAVAYHDREFCRLDENLTRVLLSDLFGQVSRPLARRKQLQREGDQDQINVCASRKWGRSQQMRTKDDPRTSE